VCPSSRHGLYRSLLRDGFPVGWFELVGFKVLVDRISFLHDQILDFQNFIGDSHVRSAPPTTQILSITLFIGIPLLLVEHYDFLRSSIGKFGSSLPVLFSEERAR